MMIERDITRTLSTWKESPQRKPLLLKGVRQCGKSWILEHFGKTHFGNVVTFNFEKNPEIAAFFTGSYEPKRILAQLAAYSGQSIVAQETMIIFDEVQLCPRALNSLKYFCEEAPEYAIASAGSLIGISIASKEGFPVGKVEIMEMHPCSFNEYLRTVAPSLLDYLQTIPLEPLADAFTAKLNSYLREYIAVGGMPAALSTFIDTHDVWAADRVLDSVMQAYESDFSKHIPSKDIPKLYMIWQSIPSQFARENRKFIYGEVRKGARAKDLEDAMQWLLNASMIRKVELAEVPELPLAAVADRKIFKLYPSDVGILRKLAKLSPTVILDSHDIFSDFKGRLAENLVLEQLLAMDYSPVCYWYNPDGQAEVDFLIQDNDIVIPVEVKSGMNLNAKSLRSFREKYNPQIAIRTSLNNLKFDNGLLNIPLYLFGELPRLLQMARANQ